MINDYRTIYHKCLGNTYYNIAEVKKIDLEYCLKYVPADIINLADFKELYKL